MCAYEVSLKLLRSGKPSYSSSDWDPMASFSEASKTSPHQEPNGDIPGTEGGPPSQLRLWSPSSSAGSLASGIVRNRATSRGRRAEA